MDLFRREQIISSSSCEDGDEHSSSTQCGGICWAAWEPFTSQEWLSSIDLRDSVLSCCGMTHWNCDPLGGTLSIMRTASLTFNNFTFCPLSVFMCFVWNTEQTTIISLYSINWWVFITETESVHCAVRTISVTLNVRLYTGHIVASDRQSSASHRGGPSSFLWLRGLWWPLGTGIGFFPSTVGSPVSAIPTAIYTLLYLFADIERQTD